MAMPVETKSVALVSGVTGMAGLAIAEALKKPGALGGPWTVYGTARRPKPSWFPDSVVDSYLAFDAGVLSETAEALSSILGDVTHVFWVALQVHVSEEDNMRVNTAMLRNVLDVLRSAPSSKLTHVTLQTGTKHYMGPIFDPAHPGVPVPPETPFLEDTPRLPYPNFYYALEDVVASYTPSVTYSVHRSSIIVGSSSRSYYNTLLTLAVYASICKYEGRPFRYFGSKYTWEHFCDMSDARVLAEQQIWAAFTDRAKNQAFNCTNGDVFAWRQIWRALTDVFGVEFVEFDGEEVDISSEMLGKGAVWDKIVAEHGLVETRMEEITCFAALSHVLHFNFQHVCSMNKSREFGFFGYADTVKSIAMWVERLREMNIIPRRIIPRNA
ncbi:hypothetical protein MLD38_038818 [Melastoma candidum]|uniref:Uncharacterized protein n=1 Tax=Melastoma candidum TaxID=119954 RepID=A0ACB9L043_9MYRT|nr:hypothetical protein MLD38_038818 [Melastoma candidum]